MSLTFTSGLSKPSGVLDKPGSIERPAFDTLYGFDAPQVPAGLIIDDVDTEANIHSTSPTNPTGEYTIAFGSDTYDLYVWTGTVWMKFSND